MAEEETIDASALILQLRNNPGRPNLASILKELAKLELIKNIDLPSDLFYLHNESLRREIHEGLNVIEQWNGATDFVFFARRGELTSNRREDQKRSKDSSGRSSLI